MTSVNEEVFTFAIIDATPRKKLVERIRKPTRRVWIDLLQTFKIF